MRRFRNPNRTARSLHRILSTRCPLRCSPCVLRTRYSSPANRRAHLSQESKFHFQNCEPVHIIAYCGPRTLKRVQPRRSRCLPFSGPNTIRTYSDPRDVAFSEGRSVRGDPSAVYVSGGTMPRRHVTVVRATMSPLLSRMSVCTSKSVSWLTSGGVQRLSASSLPRAFL